MEFNLTLIRGLPGTGKTTLGHLLARNNILGPISADDYMVDAYGVYLFDPNNLPAAHEACVRAVYGAMREVAIGGDDAPRGAVVANTFCQEWEIAEYYTLAIKAGEKKSNPLDVRVSVIDLFDAGFTDEELSVRNTHGVPTETIANMRRKYEHNWRDFSARYQQYLSLKARMRACSW